MTPNLVVPVIVALVGLIVGSFLNVCIFRIPQHRSVVWPASACGSCQRPLAWFENIPVFSYLALRGRCRTCGAHISIQYPLVEAATMAIYVLHWQAFGLQPIFFVRVVFASALIVLFAIDLEHKILPNVITLPWLILGLLSSVFVQPGIVSSVEGAVAGGGILWLLAEVWFRLRGVEAMGFGDVKMLAMVGAFLGLKLVIVTFILSSLMGGVVGGVLIATRRANMASEVPFGTMLAVAALIASLYGNGLVAWYLGNMGITVP